MCSKQVITVVVLINTEDDVGYLGAGGLYSHSFIIPLLSFLVLFFFLCIMGVFFFFFRQFDYAKVKQNSSQSPHPH